MSTWHWKGNSYKLYVTAVASGPIHRPKLYLRKCQIKQK